MVMVCSHLSNGEWCKRKIKTLYNNHPLGLGELRSVLFQKEKHGHHSFKTVP